MYRLGLPVAFLALISIPAPAAEGPDTVPPQVTVSPKIHYSFKDLAFIDRSRGYSVGTGTLGNRPLLHRTRDGGRSWSRTQLENRTRFVRDITFMDERRGIITIHDTMGCPDFYIAGFRNAREGVIIEDITESLLDEPPAFCAVGHTQTHRFALYTDDGGKHWTRLRELPAMVTWRRKALDRNTHYLLGDKRIVTVAWPE